MVKSNAEKIRMRNFIYDKLHRGIVYTCMGISVIGLTLLAQKGFEYYVYIRPVNKALQTKMQEELLQEGLNSEFSQDSGA